MNVQASSHDFKYNQALILMYHRIAEPDLDPWNLCVSPDNFRRHLDLLSEHYEFIRLSDILTCTDLSNKAIITFDDGYVDNLLMAKPILESVSAPATFFVTTGYIGGEREYWWDELEQLILLPGNLPKTLNLDIEGEQFQFGFDSYMHYSEQTAAEYRDWKVTYDGTSPPTERHALFLSLWARLQELSDTIRRRVLSNLFAWAGQDSVVRYTHRPMRQDELLEVTRGGLVEIGSHCVTHGALPSMDSASKRTEIELSKLKLENILGDKVSSLAYPHGEYDSETLQLVEDAGYSCALGTNKIKCPEGEERYQLQRKMAKKRNIPRFSRRVSTSPS